ncbi:hypothetical protein [Desulfonatronospira sp.]|uniref:type III-A CRISPR-associated RAMP protein Csm4 n=1 Tax=Desulfonatronospira sp. TaxID=1962951 RepID=UPI0025BF8D84|nr:hypothetical protein [Desulfonatronospira sp.]
MFVRYNLRIKSRLQTPLQSDSIFGRLCWAVRDLEGEGVLGELLEAMQQDKPPLLFSSGMPHDFLPRPVLPPPSRKFTRKLALEIGGSAPGAPENEQGRMFLGLSRIKKLMKQEWVSVKNWPILKSSLNSESLLQCLAQEKNTPKSFEAQAVSRAHVSLSRLTHTVLEPGGLYFTREQWYESDALLDVYCWFQDSSWRDLWERAWNQVITPVGFGQDKSTGAGHLELNQDESFNPELFEQESPNAWMSLSHAAFERFPETGCWYKPMLKLGKLGGDFAVHGPDGGRANPFKKPVIMQTPGSVLADKKSPVGRLLSGVHADTRIRHSGLCLCIPFVYGGAA